MAIYRVKKGNKVQTGSAKKNNKKDFLPGDEIELTQAEGERMEHAVELVSKADKPEKKK